MVNEVLVLIIFFSVLSLIFFENNSKKAVKFIMICYVLTVFFNVVTDFKMNFKGFNFNVDYSKINEHAENYKNQFNIFFDDIKNKRYPDEKDK